MLSLPPNRCKPEAELRGISAKQSCKRLAPSLRILCHPAEVLLERKADLSVISAVCHDPCHRLKHCIGQRRGTDSSLTDTDRNRSSSLSRYPSCPPAQEASPPSLCLCQLILSSIRHKYGSCADGAVKHLDQSLLGTAVQIAERLEPLRTHISHFIPYEILLCLRRHLHRDIRLLVRPVRIEECP